MTEQIKPELVDRAIALVRAMAGNALSTGMPFGAEGIDWSSSHYEEARAIVAKLPAPVDPDLVLAREVAGQTDFPSYSVERDRYERGLRDNALTVVAALTAIKRVRGGA